MTTYLRRIQEIRDTLYINIPKRICENADIQKSTPLCLVLNENQLQYITVKDAVETINLKRVFYAQRQNNFSLYIAIPSDVAKKLNLKKGDYMAIKEEPNGFSTWKTEVQ